MAIEYVVHCGTFSQDRKLHLLVFPDVVTHQLYQGHEMGSECGITAVFLKHQMLEGVDDVCRKYEKLEPQNSFFIPVHTRDFEKGQLTFSKGNMICEKCKQNYVAQQRIAFDLHDELEEYVAKSRADSSGRS